MSEFRRVGLWDDNDNGFLEMRHSAPSRYDEVLLKHANETGAAINAGCINLGLSALRTLEECVEFGLDRVLFLENDVAFLRDLNAINATLEAMPPDADIWQMDNFVVPNGEAEYQWLRANKREGTHFFNPCGRTFYSGACFALSRRGMAVMRDILRSALQPPDSCFTAMERIGCKRAIADTNLAIQLVYIGSVSADLWGVNSHHEGYRRGGVDYSLYNTPEGYGMEHAL